MDIVIPKSTLEPITKYLAISKNTESVKSLVSNEGLASILAALFIIKIFQLYKSLLQPQLTQAKRI